MKTFEYVNDLSLYIEYICFGPFLNINASEQQEWAILELPKIGGGGIIWYPSMSPPVDTAPDFPLL